MIAIMWRLLTIIVVYMYAVTCLELTKFSSSDQLTKVEVDRSSGNLFIGGKNLLLQVDENLVELKRYRLGPTFTTDKCFPPPEKCNSSKSNQDNYIKILAINDVQKYLLACGTIDLGVCKIYPLNDIHNVAVFDDVTNSAVFLGSTGASSVAFFGSPPISYNTSQRLLYAAMATFDRKESRFSPKTISTRLVVFNETTKTLRYFYENANFNEYSYLNVFPTVQTKYNVEFLYGFEFNGYGYYVSIQQVDPDVARTSYVTKIVQFCLNDNQYKTYVETAVKCVQGEIDYTLATAAFVKKDENDATLTISFVKPVINGSLEISAPRGSRICNYSIKTIRDHFMNIRKLCSEGAAGFHPWWIQGSEQSCQPINGGSFNDDSYCAYDKRLTKTVAGDPNKSVLTLEADICLQEIVTAVALTDQHSHPIAVIGTSDGYLMKASLKGGSCISNQPYMKYRVSNDSILQDMVITWDQAHIYVATNSSIIKFPLQSCAVYSECATCVSSRDPQGCGWCGNKCTKRDECGSETWSHNTCQPYISWVNPNNGPTQGGTVLTITGNNFGNIITGILPKVTIGDNSNMCVVNANNSRNSKIECTTPAVGAEGSFTVVVSVNDTVNDMKYSVVGTASSDTPFSYKTPVLVNVFPLMGPNSGGTNLTIRGDNFLIGNSQKVLIGDTVCKITSKNNTVIECTSGRKPQLLFSSGRKKRATKKDLVTLTIDGAELVSETEYLYMEDSTIVSTNPLQTIQHGGTRLKVQGTNLHIVQRPRIVVKLSTGEIAEDVCYPNVPSAGAEMVCTTPSILTIMTNMDQGNSFNVTVYFIMDGIESLTDLRNRPTINKLAYNPNPKVSTGVEVREIQMTDNILEINGEYLTRGVSKEDYVVTIGSSDCIVTLLGPDVLQCVPLKPDLKSGRSEKLQVTVHVGKYLKFDWGYVVFIAVGTKAVLRPGNQFLVFNVLIPLLIVIFLATGFLLVIMKKKKIGCWRDPNAKTIHYLQGAGAEYNAEGQRLVELNSLNETSESEETLAVDGGWNESEVEEITSHLQDGRLVELSKSFLVQIKNCSDRTNKDGGFGKIYISRVPIPGFKHKLVLKEIGGDDENSKSQTQLLGSVKNEKLASRVRHFAIVPLLAYHDDLSIGKYYLISPYFENGDLFDALRSDKGDNVLLDWTTRLKVIYQISCAIDYMHTNNSFRGTILHLDIKSKNIVLDKKFNARLIDFGLSRESMTGSNITTAPLAGTELYRPPGVHKTSPLLDYYAFGVVIREMLTGLGPEGKCLSQTPLGQLDMVNFENLIQRRIWILDSVWTDVSRIASQCISSVNDDETSGKISSASIRTSLKSILIKESIPKWTVLDDNNCEICLVNGQLETENLSFRRVSEINHSDCATKIKICCTCMRNSYINPVKCQECENEIKSIIGDGWGAILIAGFDEDNNSFQNDVNMFAHAIKSKVLPSMCVSTVITIDSATQRIEPMSAQIDDAFKTIIGENLHTLVFLYSGPHGEHGFKVGTNEYVSMQHINSNIQKCTHINKVIAFMDCCQPERIRVNEKQSLIQFNATASTDTADSVLNEGSPFTKLLVQTFTMKASGSKCALPQCECCIDGPFITIDSLSNYIEIHRQNGLLRGMEPEKSLIKINWQNECIAYNYSFKVAFRFDIVLPTPFTSKHTYDVLSTTVNDYDALIQTILFPRFADLLGEQLNVQQMSISRAEKIANCLCIVYDTGPKCYEEVDNIEKLLLAWNSKRLLCCKLRSFLPSNCHKPAGFFLKNGKPVKDCMHEKKEFELTEMESFIKGLQATKNKCDTETQQALTVFRSNMSSFIHGCKQNKLQHQRIQICFIDLFEECTSCVVHLLLVDPDEISEMSGDLLSECSGSVVNRLQRTEISPSQQSVQEPCHILSHEDEVTVSRKFSI